MSTQRAVACGLWGHPVRNRLFWGGFGHSTPVKRDPHAEREAREYENPVASREHIRATLEDLGGPASLRRLAGALGMRRDQEDGLEARLRAIVRDGELLRHGRGEYAVADQVALIEGPVRPMRTASASSRTATKTMCTSVDRRCAACSTATLYVRG